MLQFSRTVAPETSKGPALIALMRHWEFWKAVVFTSLDRIWHRSGLDIIRQLRNARIEVLEVSAFKPGYFVPRVLDEIKRSGIRITILMAFTQDTQNVALSAESKGMTSAGWSWLTLEEKTAVPQMLGWLTFRPFRPSEGMHAFAEQVSEYTATHFNITVNPDSVDLTYSTALYEAVMLYANAATKVLSNGDDLYDATLLSNTLRSTILEGVANNSVALDEHGDRIQTYEVLSYLVNWTSSRYDGMTFVHRGI